MSQRQKRFAANPVILCEAEQYGMLLFNPETGEVKILNATGAFIYRRLLEGESFAGIAGQIIESYDDCKADDVEKDVNMLAAQLQKLGLLLELQEDCR